MSRSRPSYIIKSFFHAPFSLLSSINPTNIDDDRLDLFGLLVMILYLPRTLLLDSRMEKSRDVVCSEKRIGSHSKVENMSSLQRKSPRLIRYAQLAAVDMIIVGEVGGFE